MGIGFNMIPDDETKRKTLIHVELSAMKTTQKRKARLQKQMDNLQKSLKKHKQWNNVSSGKGKKKRGKGRK